jgi:hypothetical protein
MRLNGKTIHAAGKSSERKTGPDAFQAPCTLILRLDCAAGTMAVAVCHAVYGMTKTVDLGVVCGKLPRNTPLHLAVCTYGPAAKAQEKITLQSYRKVAEEHEQGQPSPAAAAAAAAAAQEHEDSITQRSLPSPGAAIDNIGNLLANIEKKGTVRVAMNAAEQAIINPPEQSLTLAER